MTCAAMGATCVAVSQPWPVQSGLGSHNVQILWNDACSHTTNTSCWVDGLMYAEVSLWLVHAPSPHLSVKSLLPSSGAACRSREGPHNPHKRVMCTQTFADSKKSSLSTFVWRLLKHDLQRTVRYMHKPFLAQELEYIQNTATNTCTLFRKHSFFFLTSSSRESYGPKVKGKFKLMSPPPT